MIQVNIHDAKTRLSALLLAVEKRGVCVRICRSGKPVAELRPIPAGGNPLKVHSRLKRIKFRENPGLPLKAADWQMKGK